MSASALSQVRSLSSLINTTLRTRWRTVEALSAVAAVWDRNPDAFTGDIRLAGWNAQWRDLAYGTADVAPVLGDARVALGCAEFLTGLYMRQGVTPQTCAAVLNAFPPPRAVPHGQGRYDHIAALMLLHPTPAEVRTWAQTTPPTVDEAMFLIALRPAPAGGVK